MQDAPEGKLKRGRSPLRTADVLATFQEDLSRHRQTVIEGWAAIEQSVLNARPSPKRWSAIDCIEHVRRANAIYLRHMDTAIGKAERRRQRPVERLRPGVVGSRMRATLAPRVVEGDGEPRIGMKMPTLGSLDPVKDASAPNAGTTLERFESQLDAMRNMGQRLERIDLNVRTKTLLGPLLWLKVGDVARYLVAHTDRHLIQAERAIASARGGTEP